MPWFISDDVSKMAFLTMTLHQGGSARMYELTPDTQPSLLSTFSGDRRFSRFGGVLHFSDLDGDGLGGKGLWLRIESLCSTDQSPNWIV